MSLSSCCNSGFKHDGEPKGETKEINGVKTYVALPSGDYDKTKALLFLTDVFGVTELKNGLLLADSFAAEGYATYMPDYLNGDPLKESDFGKPDFDFMKWLGSHGKEQTRPAIDKIMSALKDQGVTAFAATGYCFGGKYVADLSHDGLIKVGIYNHPSLLEVPSELERLRKAGIPSLWNTCEHDNMIDVEKQKTLDKIFEGDKDYKRTYWAGETHGYAIRGDPNNASTKKAMDSSFEEAIAYLKKYL